MKERISHKKLAVTEAENLILKAEAKKAGLSLSNYLRQKLGMSLFVKADNFVTNNPRKKISI